MSGSFLTPILTNPEKRWVLRNARSEWSLARDIEAAFDRRSRNKGLLGRAGLAEGSALILAPCNSIHTFFMQFPIDVVFVRRDGHVVRLFKALPPWRIALAWSAFAVIELPVGAIDRADTRAGDSLQLTF